MRPALAALVLLAAAGPLRADAPPVAEDWVLHCSACHGPDGAGTPGVVPSLADTGRILLRPGGRAYLVRVPGVAQAPLSDARLARLLNWAVERHGGGSAVPPFSADEVAALRRQPLRDPASARP